MITLADNFRLGVRPEDILLALHNFTRNAKKRQRKKVDQAMNPEYYSAYNAYYRRTIRKSG